VRRFTADLRAQTDQLPSVIGTGTATLPGFASAQDLTSGKLTPKQMAVRASGWTAKLGEIQGRVDAITVGDPPAEAGTDGEPSNAVGGRVAMLSSVRDSYSAAIGVYLEAAPSSRRRARPRPRARPPPTWSSRARPPPRRAGTAMDAAAGTLARIHARYGLDLTKQMPGESTEAFGARYSGAPSPRTSCRRTRRRVRALLVFNPTAGGGRAGGLAPRVPERLSATGRGRPAPGPGPWRTPAWPPVRPPGVSTPWSPWAGTARWGRARPAWPTREGPRRVGPNLTRRRWG
jgi:hypothetical protein